mmetsp:Transcript_27717/g.44345  ORF Transcript_27717/g.44345 Transcript_27717/m.44345 type:complete len:225 (+) Transcript_27717:332-1006(+)
MHPILTAALVPRENRNHREDSTYQPLCFFAICRAERSFSRNSSSTSFSSSRTVPCCCCCCSCCCFFASSSSSWSFSCSFSSSGNESSCSQHASFSSFSGTDTGDCSVFSTTSRLSARGSLSTTSTTLGSTCSATCCGAGSTSGAGATMDSVELDGTSSIGAASGTVFKDAEDDTDSSERSVMIAIPGHPSALPSPTALSQFLISKLAGWYSSFPCTCVSCSGTG